MGCFQFQYIIYLITLNTAKTSAWFGRDLWGSTAWVEHSHKWRILRQISVWNEVDGSTHTKTLKDVINWNWKHPITKINNQSNRTQRLILKHCNYEQQQNAGALEKGIVCVKLVFPTRWDFLYICFSLVFIKNFAVLWKHNSCNSGLSDSVWVLRAASIPAGRCLENGFFLRAEPVLSYLPWSLSRSCSPLVRPQPV